MSQLPYLLLTRVQPVVVILFAVTDDIAYTRVQAVDDDGDVLIYTIQSEYFTINPMNGVISVARDLTDSTESKSS